MENEQVIHVAEFSKYPSGRDNADGSYNGTKFRSDILLPAVETAIKNNSTVRVSLADVLSFGSSFLEEAFGGLVREGIDRAVLKRVLRIDPGKPGFKRHEIAIWKHIEKAK